MTKDILTPFDRMAPRPGTFVEATAGVSVFKSSAYRSVPADHAGARHAGSCECDIVCLSHLRWNFVFQRPQHLLTRFARTRRVIFVEEPIDHAGESRLDVNRDASGVIVAVPHLRPGGDRTAEMRSLLDDLLAVEDVNRYVLWYYTPMARAFTRHLTPEAIVYDCMDELAAFAGAPAGLADAERELLDHADVVLTGGQSLYELKRHLHSNVHAVPSSVDVAHFARARQVLVDPEDQAHIPAPRLGFFGVIDERMDTELIAEVARRRADWHFVLLGPVVKIDLSLLPRLPNLHYLGPKPYAALPDYLAGWSVALLPFARNESTRFISPTKTPEYLAAGKPVVSTSIRDVVEPYGTLGLARIADTAPAFIEAIAAALESNPEDIARESDRLLEQTSWDKTWQRIVTLIEEAVQIRTIRHSPRPLSLSARPMNSPIATSSLARP
jgi:UDP-galactopyranose mutase